MYKTTAQRSFFSLLVVGLVAATSCGEPPKNPDAVVEGCLNGDCQNGQGILRYANLSYQGAFKNGRFHGQGTLRYDDGSHYEGDFVEHVQHGQGTYHDSSGTYTGTFVNGKKSGRGTYTNTAEGWSYQGEFDHNTYNGQGVYVDGAGNEYAGAFKDGHYHGYGTLRYHRSNRASYTGEWQNSHYRGWGILTYQDGRQESGIWKDLTTLATPKPAEAVQRYLQSTYSTQ